MAIATIDVKNALGQASRSTCVKGLRKPSRTLAAVIAMHQCGVDAHRRGLDPVGNQGSLIAGHEKHVIRSRCRSAVRRHARCPDAVSSDPSTAPHNSKSSFTSELPRRHFLGRDATTTQRGVAKHEVARLEVVQVKKMECCIVETDHVGDQDIQQQEAELIPHLQRKVRGIQVLGAAAAQDHCVTHVIISTINTKNGRHPSSSSKRASQKGDSHVQQPGTTTRSRWIDCRPASVGLGCACQSAGTTPMVRMSQRGEP